MKRVWGVLLLLTLLAGCGGGFYRVPPEEYKVRIKRLGVLPVLVDETSTILHPQKEEVISLLRRSAASRESFLVEALARDGGYEQVLALPVDPVQTAARLLTESTVQTRNGASYRRYQVNAAVAAELARQGGVDGLLVMVLNGVESREKRWERPGFRYLEANYNLIQATALVVAPRGEILWERPGYVGAPFLDLQYPDFSEAVQNRTDVVEVRFVTPAGLERALSARDKTLLGKSETPTLYRQFFDALHDTLIVGRGRLL